MAIGLSAKQKKELAAMLPNVEDSVASLKRLIADAKDRTKALAKLDEAEQLQRKHANEVGIPFNEDAFARRRAELNALPKVLTVEEGQLASFTALQRAIGVVVEGPYTRAGRGTPARGKKVPGRKTTKATKTTKSNAKKAGASRGPKPAKKAGAKVAEAPVRNAGRGNQPSASAGGSAASRSKPSAPRTPAKAPASAPEPVAARMPVVKPLPLSLGS